MLQSIDRSTNADLGGGADKIALTGSRRARAAKMGPKAFPALELLLSIAQEATTLPAERRRAALQVAEYYLPKNPRGRKARRRKFPPDQYGFVVDPDLARELRDSKLQLACLPLAKKLTPYAVAQRANKLQARIIAIQQSLQCPCPSRYKLEQLPRDQERLRSFGNRRAGRETLTHAEDLEEARLTARVDSFLYAPQRAARQRLAELLEKQRAAKLKYGPRLTHAEQAALRFLELLYPRPLQTTDPTRSAFNDLPIIEGAPSQPASEARRARATAPPYPFSAEEGAALL